MTPPRFHCPFPLAPGAGVDLPDLAAHHAARVLRLGPGDEVSVFDGRGGEWSARIVRLKPTVHVSLDAFDATDREPPLRVTLVQSLPSGDKMDWVVQKAVELGVASIQPVAAKLVATSAGATSRCSAISAALSRRIVGSTPRLAGSAVSIVTSHSLSSPIERLLRFAEPMRIARSSAIAVLAWT